QQQGIDTVMQHEQHGTGHAMEQARACFRNANQVLVLYGDVPMIEVATLQALIDSGDDNSLKVLTALLDDPTGYGRIVRDENDHMLCITEEKDADDEVRLINEINTGIMCIPGRWLDKT